MALDDYGHEQFNALFERLCYLERWLELAIRPQAGDATLQDADLLGQPEDNLPALRQRCLAVRQEMNHFVLYEKVLDDQLNPEPSSIPGAGLGIYYRGTKPIQSGELLCYYVGHIHSYH